jgi:hypothetical protein
MPNTVPNDMNKQPNTQAQPARRPNEAGAFDVQGHIKIFDPTTKKVYVEKRA